MRIVCGKKNGGCGRSFEVTHELLAAFFRAEMDGVGMDCLNLSCSKRYSHDHVQKVLDAARRNPLPEPELDPYED